MSRKSGETLQQGATAGSDYACRAVERSEIAKTNWKKVADTPRMWYTDWGRIWRSQIRKQNVADSSEALRRP